MARAQVGYAAMLERFHPTELVEYCVEAEAAGFDGIMAADHMQPWTPEQGNAAFVWAFMAVAAARTNGDIGPGVTCPSFRQHPAVIAQAAAIYVATAGQITAKRCGRYADGIITVGASEEKIERVLDAFAEGCVEVGKDPATLPRILQLHLSWAPTDEEALANAMREWPNGGMKFPKQDIRSPHDFAQMARLVRPEDFEGRMLISADPEAHRKEIQRFLDLGFQKVSLHNVGRNQSEWIRVGRD